MGWFQLDPPSIADRCRAVGAGKECRPPTLGRSLALGILGFTVVSVAGFAPWALFGRALNRAVGEAGMYIVCALMFIVLSGVLLHRLIGGRGSWWRFNAVFGLAFAAYSAAWIVGWMALRGHLGSVVGLLAGTSVMAAILVWAFDATGQFPRVLVALFVLNALGYFIGGWAEGHAMALGDVTPFGWQIERRTQVRMAMLLWGVFYGIGLGAGLGYAFYACQTRARALLAAPQP